MGQEIQPVQEDEGSFDLTWFGDRLSFAWLAIRRHLGVVFGAIVLLGALGLLAATAIPNRYYVEMRLLAPRPDMIASLTNPGRTLASDSRASSRAVLELMRRDNLLAAMRETDLLTQWRATRTAALRMKDRIMNGRELTNSELTDRLVDTMKAQLTAYTQAQDDGSGSLTVGLTWNDPLMTVRLLNAIIKGFLDFRQSTELAVLDESIAILEERLTETRRDLEVALAGAKAAAPRRITRADISPAPEPAAAAAVDTRTLADLAQVRSALTVKRRALDELVSFRQRRIEELQTQLTEQRAVYSENHPIVANTRRSLEAVAADSPQITALRREVTDLEARYAEKGGSVADLGDGSGSAARGGAGGSTVVVPLDPGRLRPAEDFERSRLTAAIARYYGVSDRLEGAKLERDSAQAAARYRFVVVQPPLPPRGPSNIMVKLGVGLGGICAGFLVGLFAAIVLEGRRGRIVQKWQVERGLGLPVLAVLPQATAAPGNQELKA